MAIRAPLLYSHFDNNDGTPLALGLVYTYAAGTTTPKAVYDKDGIALSNPVVLDAAGNSDIYLTSGENYRFIIKTAAGVTITNGDQDNISVVDITSSKLSVTLTSIVDLRQYTNRAYNYAYVTDYYQAGENIGARLYKWDDSTSGTDDGGSLIIVADGKWILQAGNVIDVRWFGAKGNGSTDDTGFINNAKAYLVSIGGGDLVFSHGSFKYTSALTFPLTTTLRFINGAYLLSSNTSTVTINKMEQEGFSKRFDSTMGAITFGPFIEYILPQWFGALGDGSNADSTPINAMLTQISSQALNVKIISGVYKLTANVTFPSTINLIKEMGAYFTSSSAFNVTINGGFSAPYDKAFAGSITAIMTYTKIPYVVPQWWGAVADGDTDCTASFNSAIATTRKVFLPNAVTTNDGDTAGYVINNVEVIDYMDIEGEVDGQIRYTPLIVSQNNAAAFYHSTATEVYYCSFKNILITGKSTSVTNTAFYRHVNKTNYSAYFKFINCETYLELRYGYDAFFLGSHWEHCRDGYHGNINVSNIHGFINCVADAAPQANNTNANNVVRCQVYNNIGVSGAIRLRFGYKWAIEQNLFEKNDCPMMYIRGVVNLTINNNWIEDHDADYVLDFSADSIQCIQTVVTNNFVNMLNTNIAFILVGGATSVNVYHNSFIAIDTGVVLINDLTALIECYDNGAFSGGGAAGFLTGAYANRSKIYLTDSEFKTNIINSPENLNTNVFPLNPYWLVAANFTNGAVDAFTTITDQNSSVGPVANQAVDFEPRGGGSNCAFYDYPAKMLTFLQSKVITVILSGFGDGGAAADSLNIGIWDSVAVPTKANATVTSAGIGIDTADLTTIYQSYTVTAGATSLKIGVNCGGIAGARHFRVECMRVVLGTHKPTFAGFN